MLAIISPLLLINGINITILSAGLAKCSKEISCLRNLVAARDFYNVRRTFYASIYENLVEKQCKKRLRWALDPESEILENAEAGFLQAFYDLPVA